ncbi:unnamed protein product [Spodoptera exigua]|nr:unnamed protein product [Spodoptera exigua]
MDRGCEKDFFENCELGDDDVFEDKEVKSIAKDLNTMEITKSEPTETENKFESKEITSNQMDIGDKVVNQLYFDAAYDAALYEACGAIDKNIPPAKSSGAKQTRAGGTKIITKNDEFFDTKNDAELYEVCRMVGKSVQLTTSPSSSLAGPLNLGRSGAKRKINAKIVEPKRPRYDEASTSSGIRGLKSKCYKENVCS